MLVSKAHAEESGPLKYVGTKNKAYWSISLQPALRTEACLDGGRLNNSASRYRIMFPSRSRCTLIEGAFLDSCPFTSRCGTVNSPPSPNCIRVVIVVSLPVVQLERLASFDQIGWFYVKGSGDLVNARRVDTSASLGFRDSVLGDAR
jgi:hypothetical protein